MALALPLGMTELVDIETRARATTSNFRAKTFGALMLTVSVAFGLALAGCAKPQPATAEPSEDTNVQAKSETEGINLCEAYTTCDECIDGQVSRGNTQGEAQTQCGLAVTGCWATWDKPVTCDAHG